MGTGPASLPEGLLLGRAGCHSFCAVAQRSTCCPACRESSFKKLKHPGERTVQGAADPEAKCYREFSVLFLAQECICSTAAPCCCSPIPPILSPPPFQAREASLLCSVGRRSLLVPGDHLSLVQMCQSGPFPPLGGAALSAVAGTRGQHTCTPSRLFQMSREATLPGPPPRSPCSPEEFWKRRPVNPPHSLSSQVYKYFRKSQLHNSTHTGGGGGLSLCSNGGGG